MVFVEVPVNIIRWRIFGLKNKNGDEGEFLWRVLGRLDFYIGTTNYKAAILLTFNTFIFSAVVLKWVAFLELIGGGPNIKIVVGILLSVIAICSLASVFTTFKAIFPFLESPSDPGEYHSNIFFRHISKFKDGDKYLSSIESAKAAGEIKDLAYQVHVVSKGLDGKFEDLKLATRLLLFGSVCSFGLIFCLKIILMIIQLQSHGG